MRRLQKTGQVLLLTVRLKNRQNVICHPILGFGKMHSVRG
jgi:hypothetical protein